MSLISSFRSSPLLFSGWLLLSSGATAGCQQFAHSTDAPEQAPPKADTPDVVEVPRASLAYLSVSPVTSEASQAVIRAPGRVAFREGAVADVAAPIEGRVAVIHVKVGDKVKAGDPLVTLQSPSAAASRADLTGAALASKAATRALERQTDMMNKGVGVESEKFQAEIDVAKAEADLSRAQRAVAYLGQGEGSAVVVRAPIDGTVLERKTTVGAAASPSGDALMQIGDPSAVWVVADVFERDLPLVKAGSSVELEVATLTKPITGTVVSVGGMLTTGARTAPVYVSISENDQTLRPGMYARVTVTSQLPSGVTVPNTAVLIKDGTHSVVYVEKEATKFQEREVTVGQAMEGKVQVLAGLTLGDRVVTRGALLLDGSAEQIL